MTVAALVLSVISLIVSGLTWWFTYRRSGALVRVTGEVAKQTSFVGEAIYFDVVQVAVRNRGLAPAQVQNVFYEVRGRDMS